MKSAAARTVVVAGGGSGIGLATVKLILSEGGRPVVLDRAIRDVPGGVESYVLDITDYAATRALADRLIAGTGAPEAVVNCVGMTASSAFAASGPAAWSRSLEVNFMTCVHLAHAFLPSMVARGSGRLVFVSSAAAQMGLSDDAMYAASKAAVEGFTRTLALEYARSGIGVNCVAPGPVMTPLFLQQSDKTRAAIMRHVPQRRVGTPEEVAHVLSFLASRAVPYLTGQVIGVNGALHMGH